MKKIIILLTLLSLLVIPQLVKAEGETMKIYLIPIEQIGNNRVPKYFASRYNAVGIVCNRDLMDYGFVNIGLLAAHNITPADHAALILNVDVYVFPDNLDQPITDKAALTVIFEAVNLPTDWLTASSTYRELLRKTAGMMQFNQRYAGLAALSDGQAHSLFDGGITLDSNWNSLSAQQKTWFNDTVHSFGFPQNVQGNPKIRSLVKQAGDLWGVAPFTLGGFEF